MNRLSLRRLLFRSLAHRRARSFSALVALTVSAAISTALFTLYADLDDKLHHEFRGFGANAVITAAGNSALPADALARIRVELGNDAIAVPFAYAVATTDRGTPVVVAGTDFSEARKLNQWWQVDAWPTNANAALLGQRAANFVADEKSVTLTYGGKTIQLNGAGRIRTGSEEDSRIYIPLSTFTAWTGAQATVIEARIPGSAAQIESAIARLQTDFPGLSVQPVRQLVEGESNIVDHTHALMYAAMLLISLTVGVSVLATLSASVLERRRDFALMKALGSSQSKMLSLFLAEALLLAMAGVFAGFVLGSAAAWFISQINFRTATLPNLTVLPLVLLLNLAIALAAAFFPMRVLRGLQPAALLRGE